MHRAASVLLAAALLTIAWSDATAAPPGALEWMAPAECPDASRLRRRIEALSGTPLARWPRGLVVRAAAARGGGAAGTWLLSIEFGAGGGRRVVEGESCAAVVEAAALHIALGLEARGQQRRVAPVIERTAVARGPTVQARLGAAGVVQLGALPGPGAGGAVRIGVDRGRLGAELGLAGLLDTRADLAQRDGAAEIALYWAEPAACFAPVAALRACAGVQVGWITGRGVEVDQARREGALWVAPDASLVLALPLTEALALELRALAAFPLVRPRFELKSGALLHQPDRAVGQLALGAGWRFH